MLREGGGGMFGSRVEVVGMMRMYPSDKEYYRFMKKGRPNSDQKC